MTYNEAASLPARPSAAQAVRKRPRGGLQHGADGRHRNDPYRRNDEPQDREGIMDSNEETSRSEAPPKADEEAAEARAGVRLAPVQASAVRPLDPVHSGRAAPRQAEPDNKKLIVGRDIKLTGNIGSCEKIVVEGDVEAELTDCREIEVTANGTFTGDADVEKAVIGGQFEGKLTVRSTLAVRSSGRVSGTIRFGQLEVEPGGEIVGDIGTVSDRKG